MRSYSPSSDMTEVTSRGFAGSYPLSAYLACFDRLFAVSQSRGIPGPDLEDA